MTRPVLDQFYTPPKLAGAILDRCIREGFVEPATAADYLEPSSGRGAFVHAILEQCPGAFVTAVDLDPEAARFAVPQKAEHPDAAGGRVHFVQADFLEWAPKIELEPPERDAGYRLIIGNPPFAAPVEGRTKPKPIALDHVLAALPLLHPEGRLVFLLRQSFAASQDRWDRLFKRHRPERLWYLVQRPSFTEDKRTDSSDYAVFVFGAEPAQQTLADWLDWDG
jgi:predicted RNA methylase